MERNREGRRAAAMAGSAVPSVTRRPRVKDASDDEDRLEEAILSESRAWERSKKDRPATFHVSAPMNPRNKRKRHVLPHESHGSGGRLGNAMEDADESLEETEAAASEDDDEPPPPRRPGKARVHAKEDDIVMDIPAVPRKARSSISSSSRFSSISRRQPEPQPADLPRQKSPATTQTSLNGNASPNFLPKQGRKLKPVGPKVRAVKVPKVSEPSTISDQEAEVAEALFVLARSMPSHTGLLESKVEVKLEAEIRTGSPPAGPTSSLGVSSVPSLTGLHHAGNIANGYISSHLKEVTGPVAEAPKRKRPRVVVKPEDGRVSTPTRLVSSGAVSLCTSPSIPIQSSMGAEMDLDPLHEKAAADVHGSSVDLLKAKTITEAIEEKKSGLPEDDGSEQGEIKAPKLEKQSISEMGEVQSDRLAQGVVATDVVAGDDGSSKGVLSSRPADGLRDDDGSVSKLNIDLMASPMKISSMEEEALGSSIEKQVVGDNSSAHLEEQSKRSTVSEDAARAMEAARGVLASKERVDAENSELKDDVEQKHSIKEQVASHSGRGAKDGEREREVESPKVLPRPPKEEIESTTLIPPPFVSTTLSTAASSSAPVPLAGWMGGLPQLGYYGPGAAPWAAGAPLPNPGLDVKAAHPAMQLPPAAMLSPVPRMKRCAYHVYMAHFIHHEQQLSRQSMWSAAALCRTAPYNLNIPPVNMLDNEKLTGHYMDVARKASTQQSGPSYGYTISQGGGPAMAAGSGSTHNIVASGTLPTPNHTNGAGVTPDNGTIPGSGTTSGNVMAAHAQYLQAMMQQNGFPSFPFPFNGPPGQAAQFFNSPFFPPHLMPPLSHLQPLPQQTGNVLPVQKQQAGLSPLGHSNSAQLVAPSLQQQQLQLQLAPQSPSQSQQQQQQQQQQHNHVGISPQQFGLHSDKESTVGNESHSTAESRLSAMQRTMSGQGPSNLPNLNMNPSSLMLANNIPAMSSHESDGSPLVGSGGKQTAKSQQPFQGQSPASLPSSMQPQQFTAGSGPGFQMKVLDPTLPQGYSAIANRGPVGPGPLGLVSVSSMMGTPVHGVLPGSTESSKGHALAQQQQNYVGHSPQFQRAINKAPSASEDAYAAKVRDYADDKRTSMKPVGGPPLLSRVDMEVSSPSLQGSPTSGSGASNVRMTSGVGRTLSSVNPPEVRSSRPASSAGSVQAPLLQNQPQKQAVGRAKAVPGTNVASTPAAHSVAAYADRVLPGNLSKFPGTVLPFSGQMSQSPQSSKPSQAGVKVSQRMTPVPVPQQMPASAMAKTQVQQARSSQPGVPSTPPRMIPSVSAPMMTAGTLSMSTSHSLSAAKAAVVSTSKSPSNGKGSVSVMKAGPPANKKPSVSGPVPSSVVSPGQSMSARAPVQQKSQAAAAHVPQFPQQQSSIASQQQRLGAKNQVYPQMQPQQGQYKQPFQAQSPYRPQLFLQQHQQQYMQQPSSQQQQQAISQHTQLPASHHYQTSTQNLPAQHGQAPQHVRTDLPLSHIQQQFQPVSSSQPSAANNNLSLNSPNLTLGTAVSGNMSSSASSDGADQFKGAIPRTNPPKAVYTPGNTMPSGGMPEIITTAHPTVSAGQVSSPHSGSSHYLQLAGVKPPEQKPSPDVASREDMTGARHLASPSSSQAVAASNPSS